MKKILIYADSRRDNIPGHKDYEHYAKRLADRYSVEMYLAPEKWTTTLDFLKLLKTKNTKDYELIILHTAIVDQSPRHQQVALHKIYADKKDIFDETFGSEEMQKHLNTDFGLEYEGDKTINMYSLEMAKAKLIPELSKIPNLLWISSNQIMPGWLGNYWKDRPKNISIIEEYSEVFLKALPDTINLMNWSLAEVKEYTFDNMHPTKAGSDFIYHKIEEYIKNQHKTYYYLSKLYYMKGRMSEMIKKLVHNLCLLSPTYRKVYVFEKSVNIMNGQLSTQITGLKDTVNVLTAKLTTLENDFGGHYNSLIKREPTKDKPLFLIGSGPSLVDCDITKLKNCYTMAFNRSYIAFKDWGFEPTYFAGLDHVVNNDNKTKYAKLIQNSNIARFFFTKDAMAEKDLISDKTSLVEVVEGDPANPSLDFNKKLIVGNSGLFGLQIALGLLGFKEVYLLGCDANYTDQVKGVEEINGQYVAKSDEDHNHFRKDYYGAGTTYNKPGNLKWHLPAWEAFNNNFIKDNNSGFKVYNCSKTGKLTFFPYADFSEIAKNIKKQEYK